MSDMKRHPAAQKERSADRADNEDIHVFREEEERELHSRILGMESGRQLRLRLRQVEGSAIGFRCRRIQPLRQ